MPAIVLRRLIGGLLLALLAVHASADAEERVVRLGVPPWQGGR